MCRRSELWLHGGKQYLEHLRSGEVCSIAGEGLLENAEQEEAQAGCCVYERCLYMPGAEPECDMIAELKGHLHHHHVHGRCSRGHGHPHTAACCW